MPTAWATDGEPFAIETYDDNGYVERSESLPADSEQEVITVVTEVDSQNRIVEQTTTEADGTTYTISPTWEEDTWKMLSYHYKSDAYSREEVYDWTDDGYSLDSGDCQTSWTLAEGWRIGSETWDCGGDLSTSTYTWQDDRLVAVAGEPNRRGRGVRELLRDRHRELGLSLALDHLVPAALHLLGGDLLDGVADEPLMPDATVARVDQPQALGGLEDLGMPGECGSAVGDAQVGVELVNRHGNLRLLPAYPAVQPPA